MPIYVVVPRSDPEKPRLIKAARRAQVESYLLGEYSIETADAEQGITLGAAGVKVEDVAT